MTMTISPVAYRCRQRLAERSSTYCRYTLASSGEITEPRPVTFTHRDDPVLEDTRLQPLLDEPDGELDVSLSWPCEMTWRMSFQFRAPFGLAEAKDE
jgi:hypothetical protein